MKGDSIMESVRNRYRNALAKRTEESYNTREDSGRYHSIFKEELGIIPWIPTKGEHEIDIIPYEVGENDPRVVTGKLVKGDISYVLPLWIHQGIGVTRDNFVCLTQNYRKPCPICEYVENLRSLPDSEEDLIKDLYAKRRVLYNIVVRDSVKEEEKNIQIMEIAHWFMERHLVGIAKKPREGGFIPFSDPDIGKTIFFERSGAGKDNTNYVRHQFLDRRAVISDEILASAFCLDSLIQVPTYNELYKVINLAEEVTPEEDVPAWDKGDWKTSPSDGDETVKEDEEENITCYGGGTFGVDYKRWDACEDCPMFIECRTENKALKVQLQSEQSPQKETKNPTTPITNPTTPSGSRRKL